MLKDRPRSKSPVMFMVREDLHDLAVIAERRDEPAITFVKLKERLRKNGLL